MKKIIPIIVMIISVVGVVSCNNSNDPVEILKRRIDKAEMVEYVDNIYGAKLLYPDFFQVDSIGKYCAHFSYSDENVKNLSLEYAILSPRIFDNIEDAVRILSDTLATFSRVKSGSFIKTQEYEHFPQIKCVFKYYKTTHGWASYTLTYEKQYEDAVGRLVGMLKDWKIYNEDIPEWLSDMCDFLDI